jgi:hypothetical protein
METEIVTQNTDKFIGLKLYLIQLHCFVLDYIWGIIHHTCAKDALLHTFVIFINVTKRRKYFYKGTVRITEERLQYFLQTQA